MLGAKLPWQRGGRCRTNATLKSEICAIRPFSLVMKLPLPTEIASTETVNVWEMGARSTSGITMLRIWTFIYSHVVNRITEFGIYFHSLKQITNDDRNYRI